VQAPLLALVPTQPDQPGYSKAAFRGGIRFCLGGAGADQIALLVGKPAEYLQH